MIDLAENDNEGFIPLKEIAERQEISKKYLEIIVKELVKANLLTGASGKGGGYKLCRKPEKYTVGEILETMEGTLCPVACLESKINQCPRKSFCKTLPMWKEYNKLVHNFFFNKKLSELV
jgi:Rrf2 family protein